MLLAMFFHYLMICNNYGDKNRVMGGGNGGGKEEHRSETHAYCWQLGTT
jgi:hypothetical protein